jgi:hypothetical protein
LVIGVNVTSELSILCHWSIFQASC